MVYAANFRKNRIEFYALLTLTRHELLIEALLPAALRTDLRAPCPGRGQPLHPVNKA